MTDESTALDAVHDPDPSTEHGQPAPVDKPRRRWRVSKAQMEAQVRIAATMAERRMAECAELRGQVFDASRRMRQWRFVAWWNAALVCFLSVARLAGWW